MQKELLRIFISVWLAIGLGLSAPSAQARMQRIDPGEIPELAPDEGLVLVAVDTDVDLYSVRVRKDGKAFGAGVMNDLKIGRSFRLYVAPAGVYEWREVQLIFGLRYALSDDPEFKFKVEPGKISYAGDLLFRPITVWRATVAMSNRGLAAMDWLEQQHPVLHAKYPFAYVGRYPDPFPEFYRQARSKYPASTAVSSISLIPPPTPGVLPIAVKTLWKEPRILQASLNPAGTLLALHVRNSDEEWGVELVDLKAGKLTQMAKSAMACSIEWSGDDTLLVSVGESERLKQVSVIRIDTDAAGHHGFTRIKLPREGFVVDSLPLERNHILFGSWSREGDLMVHEVDVSSQKAADAFRPTLRSRMNVGVEDDVAWFTDGDGRLRLVAVKRDDEYVLMHGSHGVYTDVMKLSGETEFDPVGASYDASVIYGITEEDRDQRELVAFDVASRKIVKTLFSKPGVDVEAPIFDSGRNPIGVTYYQSGRLVSEYFQAQNNRIGQLLQKAFPGKTVAVIDRSRDGKQMILWVDAGDQPPQLFHLDAVNLRAALLDDSLPWLKDIRFAPSEVVAFKGTDGLPLEAFLTLPPGTGKRPLVVFPHGGPIGVADQLHFDREVQFLASLGYAVLRVNFRGSDGYGKAFREAGHRNYGTLIEDDIDAAIRHVTARYSVDEQRMCVVGSSYGGYSALVAAVRWPQRFRCVVSIAGISDRILFFTASDSGRSEEGRKQLEKIMGDPRSDQEKMQATSPLYHYQNIQVPVMLAHGLEDMRVDFEHTRRMTRVLSMAGRTPVGLEFEKEGHGFEKLENNEKLWNGVAGFLRQHLGGTAASAGVTASP
ncbi:MULTISPECIES: S9 family peptidase [unclassified Pseudoxanthomonas]|uniref:alpha/beta hydrolase family protein n=1 Tax=unclassified Pseudoxanthomonas TaxID=2645906 RepID=UPI0030780B1B